MLKFVYRRPNSTSAETLAKALGGVRAYRAPVLRGDDVLVCWGEQANGTRILNGRPPLRNKLTDIRLLERAGIATVTASTSPRDGWLKRTGDHARAADLLNQDGCRADYWVKREDLAQEFRVHVCNGLSIRAGIKVPRAAFLNPHPWIRSYDSGWDVWYNGVTPAHRTIAKAAVKALDLDFGAVDLGQRFDGNLMILEINRAPALDEGNTVSVYVKAIERWIAGLGGEQTT